MIGRFYRDGCSGQVNGVNNEVAQGWGWSSRVLGTSTTTSVQDVYLFEYL
jgi:hypothetical protein